MQPTSPTGSNSLDSAGDAQREERLDEVLARYLKALDQGAAPDRDEILARHPDLADGLAEFFTEQDRLERLAGPLVDMAPASDESLHAGRGSGRALPSESWPQSGLSIADYELLEVLGKGGMGIVYRARQRSLQRLVALKMVRPGVLETPAELERFRLEAETVALLDHPNIVPVHEVGAHDGRPYFTMRLIAGGSLAEHLEEYRQDLRRTARLVAEVARAVHHAHQRGVLHRDLKPSNILLDDEGRPHVTDFGLAKRVSGEASLTDTGVIVGTPGYIAPEQTAGKRGAVTTATDVYGLGTLLYALLTGKPPFQGETPLETLQEVREKEPRPPSGVNRLVDRDLQTICLKCLEKEPARRYASAEALAEDLERWLAGEPVRARRSSAWRRSWKWARRRPALAALLGVSVLALLGFVLGLVGHNRQLQAAADRERELGAQAREEAARTAALNKFLLEDLLGQAAPEENARQKKVTVEEVLDKAAARVGKEFSGQPVLEATVRRAIGGTYRQLGLYERAWPQLELVRALRQASLGPEHPDTLEAVNELGLLLLDQGKRAEAESLFRRNLEIRRRVLGSEHSSTLTAVNNLALVLHDQGKLAEAEVLYRQNWEVSYRVQGPDHPDTRTMVSNLASLLLEEGKLVEAEPLIRQNLEVSRRVLGPDHPDSLIEVNNLAMLLQDLGKWAEAEALLRPNLETRRRVQGPEHPDTLAAVNNLAALLRVEGKLTEAEPLLRQNLKAQQRVQGSEHPDTLRAVNNLATLLRAEGKLAEAEPLYRQNLVAYRRLSGPDHPDTLVAMTNLASLFVARHQLVEAESLMREGLSRAERVLPPGHPVYLKVLAILGDLLTEQAKPTEAEPLLRRCLEGCTRELPRGHLDTAKAQSLLGACLLALNRYAEAEPLLLQAHEILRKHPGTSAQDREHLRERLGQLYGAWGRPAEAAKYRSGLTPERGKEEPSHKK